MFKKYSWNDVPKIEYINIFIDRQFLNNIMIDLVLNFHLMMFVILRFNVKSYFMLMT